MIRGGPLGPSEDPRQSAAPGCRRLPSRAGVKIVKGKSRVEALVKPAIKYKLQYKVCCTIQYRLECTFYCTNCTILRYNILEAEGKCGLVISQLCLHLSLV